MKHISWIDLVLYIALGSLSIFILFGHIVLPHEHTEEIPHEER